MTTDSCSDYAMSEPSPEEARARVKRMSDEDGESLERPAKVARSSSAGESSSYTNQLMDEILHKLEEIKAGRDISTTVTQHLGRCLRAAARKANPDIFHWLLHMDGLDVNDVDVRGISAMMFACYSGCEELLEFMLEDHKFDPSLQDKIGNGLLHYAVKNNHLHIVDLLLADQRIASIINGRTISGISPLILACCDGRLEIAQKLLSFPGVDVNSPDDNGDSPLLHAVTGGFEELVSELLENPQIKVNKSNDNGDSPLMVAANEGHSDIVARLLKQADIDVNSSNTDGYSSLMCASDKGCERIVELLLAHPGIDINHKDTGGDSALVWAVDKNQGRVVDLLLNQEVLEPSPLHVASVTFHLTGSGAHNLGNVCLAVSTALNNRRHKLGLWLLKQRIRAIEEDGNFTEHIENILVTAVSRGAKAIVDFLVRNSRVNLNILDDDEPLLIRAVDKIAGGYVDIVRSLISSTSCDINVRGSTGKTALSVSCSQGNEAMVAVLLSHPEVDVNTGGDLSPLLCAVRSGNKAVVDLLLARKDIQVNITDIRAKSALILAGQLGHTDIVRRLVEQPELEINIKDEDGITGLIWAAARGHPGAVTEFMNLPEIDVNVVDLNGYSALTCAAIRGHTEVVALLLEDRNLEVNVRDLQGFSPLIFAAKQGHTEVVKLLLADSRTDVNLKVQRGERPDLCSSLTLFNIFYSLQDNDGWTAVLSAVNSSNISRDVSKKDDFKEIVRSLLNHPKMI